MRQLSKDCQRETRMILTICRDPKARESWMTFRMTTVDEFDVFQYFLLYYDISKPQAEPMFRF